MVPWRRTIRPAGEALPGLLIAVPLPSAIMNRKNLVVVLALLTAASGQAATLYVSVCGDNANSGATNNCGQPNGPKATIAAAIAASADGDTIIVGPGTFQAGIDLPARQLTIRSIGGAASTIITGGGPAQPLFDLVFNGSSNTHFEGFTFTGANVTSGGGGAAIRTTVPIHVRACRFVSNTTTGSGPAIRSSGAELTLTDCEFDTNSSTFGGMVTVLSAPLTVTRCRFYNAPASPGAGAINMTDGALFAYDSVFVGNRGQTGAAIFGARVNMVIERCWFEGNIGGPHAAISGFGGPEPMTMSVRNCVFRANAASTAGGAISLAGEVAADVEHCTFYANTSSGPTWASTLSTQGAARATIRNCIFEGGAAPSIVSPSPDTTVSFSMLSDAWSGDGWDNIVGEDPRFVDAVAGDLRLLPDSPALGAAIAAGPATSDILGLAREASLPCSPDGRDMGAFELQAYDFNSNSLADACEILAGVNLDCSQNGVLDAEEFGPFPRIAIFDATGSPQRAVGAPDDVYVALGLGQITLDFGDRPISNDNGQDFNVYEVDFGASEFGVIDILVSNDGLVWRSVKGTESPAVAIVDAEQHNNPIYARSYDLGPVNLGAARYVRVQGLTNTTAGAGDGFDLDAVGAIHQQALPACPSICIGDTNGDNVIDFADLNNVLSAYNTTGAQLPGDVDDDGDVDFADLNTVLSVYNTQCL